MFTLDKRLSSLMIGLLLLVFTACTPQVGSIPNTGDGQTAEAASSLADTKWTLASFSQVGGELPVVNGSTITLEFNAQGQAVGSGGCNAYTAHDEVQGNMLSFSEITHTLMACQQEGIGQQEKRYFQALETTSRFESSGDRLMIWYDDGRGVLNLVRSNGNFNATPTPATTTEPTSIPTSAGAQSTPTPERIDFEAGAISTTLTGALQTSGSHQYVLSALAGQVMTVDLSFTEGRAILVIWGQDGTVLLSDHAGATRFQDVLPSTQDYYIQLKGRPDGSTHYSLKVTIPPLQSNPPTPLPERIHFESGAASAAVTGHLQASGSDQYVLSASGGQTMTVNLSFSEGQAILVIWGADGTVLMSDHAEASYFNRVLSATQDYYILVRGRPDGETVYRMDVTIPPSVQNQ